MWNLKVLTPYLHGLLQNHWSASGLVLSILAAFIFWLLKKSPRIQISICLGLAAICFLIASYESWDVEYKKTHPGLRLEINALYPSYKDPSGVTNVAVIATVRNLDEPSIADSWKLIFVGRDGAKKTGMVTYIPQESSIGLPDGYGHMVSYSAEDSLREKVENIAVPTGGSRTGLLFFQFTGLEDRESDVKGDTYQLECNDAKGTPINTSYTLTGEHLKNAPIIPGMHEPIEPKQSD